MKMTAKQKRELSALAERFAQCDHEMRAIVEALEKWDVYFEHWYDLADSPEYDLGDPVAGFIATVEAEREKANRDEAIERIKREVKALGIKPGELGFKDAGGGIGFSVGYR